jgi:hypothetical protein
MRARRADIVPDLRCNAAAGLNAEIAGMKKRLTIGVAREWLIALVVACIAILVLIGVATITPSNAMVPHARSAAVTGPLALVVLDVGHKTKTQMRVGVIKDQAVFLASPTL